MEDFNMDTLETLKFALMVNKLLDDTFPDTDEAERMTILTMVISIRARKTFPKNCSDYTKWSNIVREAVHNFPEMEVFSQ